MKIGIYSPYLDTLGGGERYMLTLASCLSGDNDVHVFWNSDEIKHKAASRFGVDLENVQITPNIFDGKMNFFEKLKKRAEYELIILLSDGSIPYLLSRNTIVHFQQPIIGIGGDSMITRMKLRQIKRVICNSFFTKKYIDREFNISSEVVYPPIDIEKFRNVKEKKKIILTVGRIHPVKKHQVLIETFLNLNKQMPEWKLVIAGGLLEKDTHYYESLKTKMYGNITILPNVSFSEMQKLYQEASIYWHAAGFAEEENTHPERFEHFGIAPVEAMAAGAVPLLYHGGGLPEILRGKEEKLLWKTKEELHTKTISLTEDKREYENLTEWVLARSHEFSIQNFCKKIQELI